MDFVMIVGSSHSSLADELAERFSNASV